MNVNALVLYLRNRLFLCKNIGGISNFLDRFILAFHYFHYFSEQLLILDIDFSLSVHIYFKAKLLEVSELSWTFLIN